MKVREVSRENPGAIHPIRLGLDHLRIVITHLLVLVLQIRAARSPHCLRELTASVDKQHPVGLTGFVTVGFKKAAAYPVVPPIKPRFGVRKPALGLR